MVVFFRQHPKFDTSFRYKRRGRVIYRKRGKTLPIFMKYYRSPRILKYGHYKRWFFDGKPTGAPIVINFAKKLRAIRRLKKQPIRKLDTIENFFEVLKKTKEFKHSNFAKFKHKLFRICLGHLIKRGRKGWAEQVFAKVLFILKNKFNRNPEQLINTVFEKLRPVLGLRPKKRGGVIYKVPFLLKEVKQQTIAVFWLVSQAKLRTTNSLAQSLADEISDVFSDKLQGSLKKKVELHKTALANRPFLS